jgi:hypothetical protein
MTIPRGRFLSQVLPWLVTGTVLVLLLISRMRFEKLQSDYGDFRERVTAQASANLALRTGALTVGDSLPSHPALNGPTGRLSLAELPESGYRFIYLYRDDCPACALLAPAWSTVSRDEFPIAFVAYRPGTSVLADTTRADHYGAIDSASVGRTALSEFVPALIEIRSDGMITRVADGVSPVIRMMRLHEMAPRSQLDSMAQLVPGARP